MSARFIRLGLLVSAFALGVPSLSAQGLFTGRWTIKRWQPAPWLDPAARKAVAPDSALLGARVMFNAHSITAPKPLACGNPRYETNAVPLENLFEGGLTAPKTQGPALGFPGPLVQTLMPGCDFEFHLTKAGTALFALDNVIYTMARLP